MDTSFLSMDETTDALTCAQTMARERKGYVVVTRGGGSAVAGIVTEWDFVEKVIVPQADPKHLRLMDFASPTIYACGPETPTDEVVAIMSKHGVRRLIVRTGERVFGIITAKNVLAIFRQYVDKLSAEIAGYQSSQTPLG